MTRSGEQKTTVFSGTFALIWIGEAVVTAQIKLLGGNMYVSSSLPSLNLTGLPFLPFSTFPSTPLPSSQHMIFSYSQAIPTQFLLPIRLPYRLHSIPPCYRRSPLSSQPNHDRPHPRLHRPDSMGNGRGYQHPGRQWRGPQSCRDCSISTLCLLRCFGMFVFY